MSPEHINRLIEIIPIIIALCSAGIASRKTDIAHIMLTTIGVLLLFQVMNGLSFIICTPLYIFLIFFVLKAINYTTLSLFELYAFILFISLMVFDLETVLKFVMTSAVGGMIGAVAWSETTEAEKEEN